MFKFKQFGIKDEVSAMKVGTDGVLLGAWALEGCAPHRVIDVGAGTALVSLMLAQRFGSAAITAIEIDSAAVAEARDNVSSSPWHDRIDVTKADFMSLDTNALPGIDAIVSNPPFYTEPLLSPDSRRALARHGTTLTPSTLVERSAGLLAVGGRLSMIIPVSIAHDIVYLLAMNRMDVCRLTEVVPREGQPPARMLLEAIKGTTRTYRRDTLCIRTRDGDYSPPYRRLTSPFYLHF